MKVECLVRVNLEGFDEDESEIKESYSDSSDNENSAKISFCN